MTFSRVSKRACEKMSVGPPQGRWRWPCRANYCAPLARVFAMLANRVCVCVCERVPLRRPSLSSSSSVAACSVHKRTRGPTSGALQRVGCAVFVHAATHLLGARPPLTCRRAHMLRIQFRRGAKVGGMWVVECFFLRLPPSRGRLHCGASRSREAVRNDSFPAGIMTLYNNAPTA